jgi:hypothetical protein
VGLGRQNRDTFGNPPPRQGNKIFSFYFQVTDKFMDLSIEKTNSAYMLFYEKVDTGDDEATAGPRDRFDRTPFWPKTIRIIFIFKFWTFI